MSYTVYKTVYVTCLRQMQNTALTVLLNVICDYYFSSVTAFIKTMHLVRYTLGKFEAHHNYMAKGKHSVQYNTAAGGHYTF